MSNLIRIIGVSLLGQLVAGLAIDLSRSNPLKTDCLYEWLLVDLGRFMFGFISGRNRATK